MKNEDPRRGGAGVFAWPLVLRFSESRRFQDAKEQEDKKQEKSDGDHKKQEAQLVSDPGRLYARKGYQRVHFVLLHFVARVFCNTFNPNAS
ncbi:MAG: hypothetical protein WA021_02405 [Minisyncoccia bacterium]